MIVEVLLTSSKRKNTTERRLKGILVSERSYVELVTVLLRCLVAAGAAVAVDAVLVLVLFVG